MLAESLRNPKWFCKDGRNCTQEALHCILLQVEIVTHLMTYVNTLITLYFSKSEEPRKSRVLVRLWFFLKTQERNSILCKFWILLYILSIPGHFLLPSNQAIMQSFDLFPVVNPGKGFKDTYDYIVSTCIMHNNQHVSWYFVSYLPSPFFQCIVHIKN